MREYERRITRRSVRWLQRRLIREIASCGYSSLSFRKAPFSRLLFVSLFSAAVLASSAAHGDERSPVAGTWVFAPVAEDPTQTHRYDGKGGVLFEVDEKLQTGSYSIVVMPGAVGLYKVDIEFRCDSQDVDSCANGEPGASERRDTAYFDLVGPDEILGYLDPNKTVKLFRMTRKEMTRKGK